MGKKLTKSTKISSPQNKQIYPTVQVVTDNRIKHKHTLKLAMSITWGFYVNFSPKNDYTNGTIVVLIVDNLKTKFVG